MSTTYEPRASVTYESAAVLMKPIDPELPPRALQGLLREMQCLLTSNSLHRTCDPTQFGGSDSTI